MRYEESSVTGLDGVRRPLKSMMTPIVLLRTGAVNMRHQYVRGEDANLCMKHRMVSFAHGREYS